MCHLCGLGQVLLIRSFTYLSHRLALQAEIGQIRSIIRIGSQLLPFNRYDQTNPTTRDPSHGACQNRGQDVQEDACRRYLGRKRDPPPSANSLVGQMGRLPPANRIGLFRTRSVAQADTAHPIVNFDTIDRLTLERFDSRAGRLGCNSSARRSGGGTRGSETGPWRAKSLACQFNRSPAETRIYA